MMRDACSQTATSRSVRNQSLWRSSSLHELPLRGGASARHAWQTLRACTPPAPKLNWSACRSDAYEAFFARLVQSTAGFAGHGFALAQLQLPAHTRLLFYGHSFMKQIVDELFCGSGRLDVRESGVAPDGTGRPSYLVLHDPLRNTTLTSVTNHAPLQHSRALDDGTLPAFLQTRAFDVVFYMPAHADCFFWYQQLRCEGRAARPCINLSVGLEQHSDTAARNARTWQLMQRHARFGATLVRGWGTEPTPSEWPPAWANVPRHATIDGTTLVHTHLCHVPDCAPHTSGHQCRPSAVSLLARLVASSARARAAA